MAWQIEKITVDGVVFAGCRHNLATDATEAEIGAEGIDEATVTAASSGSTLTITAVASPTGNPNVGPSRGGINYTPLGRLGRCAVCGYVYHIREMLRPTGRRAGAGQFVCRECFDEVIPQFRTGGLPRLRRQSFGGF